MSSLSKKVRFEVFKRDGFTCQYCGKTPPQTILEVDHIEPKSRGGADDINNLITACFDCNRGKSNIPLDKIPSALSDNIEVLREKEEQIKSYRKFINQTKKRMQGDIDQIDAIYVKQYPAWRLNDAFKNGSLRIFLQKLPVHEVEDSMHIAISKYPTNEVRVIKYFCGICWRKIRQNAGEEIHIPGWRE